jgi:Ca2+-binding RTX toxin-like protein
LFGGLGTDKLYGDDYIGYDEKSCPIVMDAIGNPDTCRDWLFGGLGDDFLFGGPGNDSIHGDIAPITCSTCDLYYPDEWIEQWNQGGPLPEFGNDQLHGNWGNDWIADKGSSTGTMENRFYGGEGDDILIGGENGDSIWGGPGHDEAWGNAGDDSLYGDINGDPYGNTDKLYGGEGKDFLSIADVMLGGPNPPGDPDTCKDNKTTFPVECDDGD